LADLLPGIFIFVLGAAVGSFLNVVIYRVPAGLSLLHPPSRCPHCETRLKPYDNVPILGWLWLRGCCRYCQAPISVRYPLVEFVTGCLFLSIFSQFGWALSTPGFWVLTSWLLALALIDLDTLTLPNSLTSSGVCLGWLFQGGLAHSQGNPIGMAVIGSMATSVLGIWLFDIITILGSVTLGKTAMGGGDAKLAALLGAWLGWQGLLLSTLLACGLGVVLGGGAIATGWLKRQYPIPFGPFLALGALITLFYGPRLIQAYLDLFFPMA
jgi:leader peptidase (prepilin peptidase)/N-methyltransferase